MNSQPPCKLQPLTLKERIDQGLVYTPERNTFYVTTLTLPDDAGRQRFEMEWIADNTGYSCNETGLRYQIFFGELQQHITRLTDEGKTIIFTSDLS